MIVFADQNSDCLETTVHPECRFLTLAGLILPLAD